MIQKSCGLIPSVPLSTPCLPCPVIGVCDVLWVALTSPPRPSPFLLTPEFCTSSKAEFRYPPTHCLDLHFAEVHLSVPTELTTSFFSLPRHLEHPTMCSSCAHMVLRPGFSQYFVVRIVSPHLQWPLPCHSRCIIHGCLVEGEWMADQELNITEFLMACSLQVFSISSSSLKGGEHLKHSSLLFVI